jgi:hypothetical protein
MILDLFRKDIGFDKIHGYETGRKGNAMKAFLAGMFLLCLCFQVAYGMTIGPNGSMSIIQNGTNYGTLRAPPGSIVNNLTVVPVPDSSPPGTWSLSLMVTDVPENVPMIVFVIAKGSGNQAEELSSPLVNVQENNTASVSVIVESNDIGDGDTYSVCYQGQFQQNPNVLSAHVYCSSALTHHGENSHIVLHADYGDNLS